MPPKRLRKANWSKEEQRVLVAAISPVYSKLFGRLSTTVTNEVKGSLWDQVQQQVNGVSNNNRTLQDIKDKFKDLKSKTKQKAATILNSMKVTGGGEVDENVEWDQLMDSIYSLDNHEKIMAKLIGKEGVLGIAGFNLDIAATAGEPIVEFPEGDSQRQLVVYLTAEDEAPMTNATITEVPPTPEPVQSVSRSGAGGTGGIPGRSSQVSRQSDGNSLVGRGSKDIAQKLLDAQMETNVQTKRIADSLEQLVQFQKDKYNL